MKRMTVTENGLHLVFEINGENEIKLLHFSALPFDERTLTSQDGTVGFRLAEVQISGLDRPGERHGLKYVRTAPGYRLKYQDFSDTRNELGRKLVITMADEPLSLIVRSHLQFYDGVQAVRSWTEVVNSGGAPRGLEYVSSFALTGVEKEGLLPFDQKLALYLPHNGWQKELHWNRYTLADLGMSVSQPAETMHTSKYINISNTGNWSTKEYLPMGCLYNQETNSSLYWQIEHNGSWHWEIADQDGHLYLQLSGPTENQSHWWKNLKPGETFTTVPVCVGSCPGGFDEAMGQLTAYRRGIRRKNRDNETLAVIFNDYMNCLWADPTTEKELPLIDKAAEAGCEYYCVDAGWYSDGFWWDNVGEWKPAEGRFPGGLKEVMDYIRKKGMVPGVWLEIEVMGIKCPLADQVPREWYFLRHGEKVYDRSRYQLDFRHPGVIAHANGVIDRLVREYGVGYIKMDYNIEPGIGTEVDADSFGDGLLGHQRAYLQWLDSVFARYPELIIENCSSGGLRMDYALLSRHSIQSTSDQEDYRRYATISANAPSALTPEQAAIWSYPLSEGDEEEVIFNMVNSMLLRIHQSGHLANLSPERFALVQEGISCYKGIRQNLKTAVPFWPLGLSSYGDEWVSLGLKSGPKTYVALWRRGSASPVCTLPVKHLLGRQAEARCLYPARGDCSFRWNPEAGSLTAELPHPMSARLFELTTGD